MAQDSSVVDNDYTYYKNLDISNATPAIQNPMIRQLQENARLAQVGETPFDDDVVNWVSKQDSNTRNRVNEMIRQVMGMYPAV